MVSYKVESPHLNLTRDILKAIDVPAEKILSGRWGAPTQGSYGHMAPTLVVWKNITSNNVWTVYDADRNGYASAQIDDGVGRGQYHFPSFDRWKAPKPMSEYVSPIVKTPESYVAVKFEERQWQAPEGQTPLRKFVTDAYAVDYPNNGLGPAISRAGTFKQDIIDYLRTEEGKSAFSHLLSIGGKPEVIDYVVVGDLPKGAIFGVSRLNGKVAVHVAEDAYDLIVSDARYYGIKPGDRKNAGILEELTHIHLGHLDDYRDPKKIEREAKLVQAGFYAEKEEDAASGPPNPRNTKARERYRGLKEFRIDDASTVHVRYKDIFSKYSNDKASLREKFAEDARKKGLTRGGEIEEYVERRLAQIDAEVKGEASNLEAIVDRSRNTESETPREADSREAATSDATSN